jgi:hypothetical protein
LLVIPPFYLRVESIRNILDLFLSLLSQDIF